MQVSELSCLGDFVLFGSVQVAELKAAKNSFFNVLPGVLKTTVKTSAVKHSQTQI